MRLFCYPFDSERVRWFSNFEGHQKVMSLEQKSYLFVPKRLFIACQLVINSMYIAGQKHSYWKIKAWQLAICSM